jgi:ABC-type lipoprotein export system ATPase subunit
MRELLVEGVEVSRKFRLGGADVEALRPASFTLRAGDRIALIGPSGSGKSTLVHLIADLDIPSGGTLDWPALGPRGTLRPKHVGIVFQAPSLLPTLSAIENVEVPLRLSGGVPSPREVAMRAMESVGLADVADKLPEELSGGQAQRVGLARAIASRPRLILADEPTGQLDRNTARQVIDALLASLEGTDAALVIATHDLEVAQRMRHVWTMDHGELRIPAPENIA